MKKLVIVAAAVAMAAVAQAAQVTWTANTIAQSGTSTSYYGAILDVTGLTDITVDSVAKSYMGGTFAGKTVYAGAATWVAAKEQVVVAFAKKTTASEYANSEEISYMTVLYDASTAANAQNYMVTSGSSPVSGQFSAAGLLSIQQGSKAGVAWTSAAVPEPTSGLLMLLGIAGLALRRRRA